VRLGRCHHRNVSHGPRRRNVKVAQLSLHRSANLVRLRRRNVRIIRRRLQRIETKSLPRATKNNVSPASRQKRLAFLLLRRNQTDSVLFSATFWVFSASSAVKSFKDGGILRSMSFSDRRTADGCRFLVYLFLVCRFACYFSEF
jgi:hypothetical protein